MVREELRTVYSTNSGMVFDNRHDAEVHEMQEAIKSYVNQQSDHCTTIRVNIALFVIKNALELHSILSIHQAAWLRSESDTL